MTDKEKILAKIEFLLNETNYESFTDEVFGKIQLLKELKSYIDSLQEEPVSEELEEASRKYADNEEYDDDVYFAIKAAFKEGAQWQKANLWKPADGDDLPEIDREVIVLYQRYPIENNEYAVGFGHRPKEYWDGRNIETDEVTRYYPKKYDKGGWNSPDVKWWLDLELFKTEGGEA